MTILETLSILKDSIYTVVGELKAEVWVNSEPVPFRKRFSGEHKTLSEGDKWGSLFDCGWFHFTGQIPVIRNQNVPVLLLDVNGELLMVDNEGKALRGLTSKSSTFDRTLGEPVKRVFYLPAPFEVDDVIDYWADASCNDLFGELKENGTLKQADIALCREDIRHIYYDIDFLINMSAELPKGDQLNKRIVEVLERLTSVLVDLTDTGIHKSISILENFFNKNYTCTDFFVSAIGHSHLDLAWLWPIRETRRKIARTLSTVFELMERYPDYVYGISQPQLLTWLSIDYPDLYIRLKQMVKEGRIEALGAMWVESDTNLPSGESLVRQILYGVKFWKEEFGLELNNLWLPDVFGYSGALPQILKLTDVEFFTTMKLSWNSVNRFPFNSFQWKGIDGSTVLAHMLPEETYNGPASPGSVFKIVDNYQEKKNSNHALMVFGIGDGGGGPGAEHLERLHRLKRMQIKAKVTQEKVSDFFYEWKSQSGNFPIWEGELYLEKHQGTYTTEGLSKWYNRKMELKLRELEFVSVLELLYTNKKYPADTIEKIWKEVLLYQFHDILPGSSIKRVYDESWERYGILLSATDGYIHSSVEALINSVDYTILEKCYSEEFSIMALNTLSWERTEWAFINDRWALITIPSMGYVVLPDGRDESPECEFSWDSSTMENKKIRLQFNSDGSLCSFFDKEHLYEVLKKGRKGNQFAIFCDTGDAWDFPEDYRVKDLDRFTFSESTIEISGPELINHQVYEYRESILRQDIVLTAESRRIDFRTRISWSNSGKMVRTSFPVNIPSGIAMCEIQFGAKECPVHSDNSWEEAKDEIAAQKWIDISNDEYGAALLNDSKYGHRVKDRVLDLCLLRSVPYPGPGSGFTDIGEHNFVYSLFCHPGGYSEGGVVQAAYELNSPLTVYQIQKTEKKINKSLFSTGDSSLVISTIKKAEKSDAVVVRLYEASGKRISTWFTADILQTESTAGNPSVDADLVNLLEDFQQKLIIENCRINLVVKPYEIITIKLSRNPF